MVMGFSGECSGCWHGANVVFPLCFPFSPLPLPLPAPPPPLFSSLLAHLERDVPWAHGDARAHGLEGTSPAVVQAGVVAEQREVGGVAGGGEGRRDGGREGIERVLRQGVISV